MYIYWFTDKRNTIENNSFTKLVGKFSDCFSQIYSSINIIMNEIAKIAFINTYIIITESTYKDFIGEFKKKMREIRVIPKFIIYTRDKSYKRVNNTNNSFFNYGGKFSSFDDIATFIQNDQIISNIEDISDFSDTLGIQSRLLEDNEEKEAKLILDPIESLKQMYLPIYFKTLVKVEKSDIYKFDKFTKELYKNYKKDKDIEKLLSQIIKMKHIPIELLSKYWVRVYTGKYFHYDMNDYLNQGKSGEYTLFIKMMFEALKLKVFESPIIKILYRGAHMQITEINNIKKCFNKKSNKLAAGILFCRAFLSFSCLKEKAIRFALSDKYFDNNTMKRVLFELTSNEKINQTLNTHADVEQFSFYPDEKEILFFPFSAFEIIGYSLSYEQGEELTVIKLTYLSRNDSRLRRKKNLDQTINDDKLIDSEFKSKIKESNIIDKDELDNSSISSIINKTNHYFQEEQSIIDNSQNIQLQQLEEINYDISEIYSSSKEIFENNNGNQNFNPIDNIEVKNINNLGNKTPKLKRYLIIFIIIFVISALIIFIVIVVTKKINKKDKNQIDSNSDEITSDQIKDYYIFDNSNIAIDSYINGKHFSTEDTNYNENSNNNIYPYENESQNSIKDQNSDENSNIIIHPNTNENQISTKDKYSNENSDDIDNPYILDNSYIIKKTNINEDSIPNKTIYTTENTNQIIYKTSINNPTDVIKNTNQIIYNTSIINPTDVIHNSDKTGESDSVESSEDDLYPYINESSIEYQYALIELEKMNYYRKKHGVGDLQIDLELINLVYEDILEMLYTGNINIGGTKNNKGENLGQYLLLHFSNNTLSLGYATESWYESKKNSFEENDCMISNITTNYGFGAICVSNGCIAMAYFYPANSDAGYGLVN